MIVALFVSLGIFSLTVVSQAQPQAPQIPPAVQQIIDKLQQGGTPSPAEQEILMDWGQSMAAAVSRIGGNKAEEQEQEEVVLKVRTTGQSRSHYDYSVTNHPPGIGTEDITAQGSDRLQFEYNGETRYRVEWTSDLPVLEVIDQHASLAKSGGGSKHFEETYTSNSGGGTCTDTEKGDWTYQGLPVELESSMVSNAQFDARDHVTIIPYFGGCSYVINGTAFSRDECSHPNHPLENHPEVASIMRPGTK